MAFICRICKNESNNKLYRAKEMMFGTRHEFDYFQCDECECLQIVEFPENIANYYPSDYYSFGKYDGKKFEGFLGSIKKVQYKTSALGSNLYRITLGKIFGKKEYKIFNDLKINKNTRILDVGCGNGRNFLYPLAEVGFTNVVGCDPYLKKTITYNNGLVIQNKSIDQITGEYDIITYHHAFEHLPDPYDNLKKVHELLADNGFCIIRIPVVSSFAWKHYGVDWVQLDAPRHFFLHSKKSMQILAEKTGFDLVKVECDSTHFQFTGSERYMQDIPLSAPKSKGFKSKIERKLSQFKNEQKAKQLNRVGDGDQAAFYLRKK